MLTYKEIHQLILDTYGEVEYSSKANESTFEIKISNGNVLTHNDFTPEQIQQIKNRVIDLENQAKIKRQAALDKLAALGLEPDDLKALGL